MVILWLFNGYLWLFMVILWLFVSAYALRGQIRCCHPRSLRESGKRVLYPSPRHHSTGSTVATFLTQDDLVSLSGSFVSTLGDVNEDEGSGGSNTADDRDDPDD